MAGSFLHLKVEPPLEYMPTCIQRCATQTRNMAGRAKTLTSGSKQGIGSSSGSENLNLCIRLVKNRNSSILAKCSPTQDRRPVMTNGQRMEYQCQQRISTISFNTQINCHCKLKLKYASPLFQNIISVCDMQLIIIYQIHIYIITEMLTNSLAIILTYPKGNQFFTSVKCLSIITQEVGWVKLVRILPNFGVMKNAPQVDKNL